MSNQSNRSRYDNKLGHRQIVIALIVLAAASAGAWAKGAGKSPISAGAKWKITARKNGSTPYYHYDKADPSNVCNNQVPVDQPGGAGNHPMVEVCKGDTIRWAFDKQPGYTVTVTFNQTGHSAQYPPLMTGWSWSSSSGPDAQATTNPDPTNNIYKYTIDVSAATLHDDPEIKIGGGGVPPLETIITRLQKNCNCHTPECTVLWRDLLNALKAKGLY